MTEPRTLLDRDDIATGLRELIAALSATGEVVQLRIIGGAEISLAYNSQRSSTVDIDAVITPRSIVLDVAGHVAQRHGWVADWLNDAAGILVPEGFGRRVAEWVLRASTGAVKVYVASAETLLAMKLKATIRRGLRELSDLRVLLALTGITTVKAVDDPSTASILLTR